MPRDELKQSAGGMLHGDDDEGAVGRTCAVCGDELAAGNRKVHAGRCARVRKTLLQKTARVRRRT